MQGRIRFLFDSDVLIASARLHYAPKYCQVFWDWLTWGHQAGYFYSIDKVKGELLDGKDDPLEKWAEKNSSFFLSSKESLPYFGELSLIANDPKKNFTSGAKQKFLNLDKADAWLIAYAKQEGNFVIVTNEVSAPNGKREIKLPDAAAWLGVKTVKIYDILSSYAGHNFSPLPMSAKGSKDFYPGVNPLPPS